MLILPFLLAVLHGCGIPPGEDPADNRYSEGYVLIDWREELAQCLERQAQDRHAQDKPGLVRDSLTRIHSKASEEFSTVVHEAAQLRLSLDSARGRIGLARHAIAQHQERESLFKASLCAFFMSCAFWGFARRRRPKRDDG